MQRQELAAWLRLLLTPGVGKETARKLLAAFGLPEAVFAQPLDALQTVVGPKTAQALQRTPDTLDAQVAQVLSWLAEDARRHVLTLADPRFPPELLQMADPPVLLYVLGDLDVLAHPRRLAMVGSRNPRRKAKPTPTSSPARWAKRVCAWFPVWRWGWTARRTRGRSTVARPRSRWWAPVWTACTRAVTWRWRTASPHTAPS